MSLNFFICLCSFVICYALAQQAPVPYDAYFGTPITDRRRDFLSNVVNGTSLCVVPVRSCRKDEGRRVDGTCVNPKYPSRGASMTPFLRLLPAKFGPGNTLRPAKDGSELPSTRLIRTTLLADGIIRDHDFTSLAANVLVFSIGDNVDLVYLLRYSFVSDCCINSQTPNRANPQCIPISVPRDDPFLRRTGIRCMNLTKVETYQDFGCLPQSLPAERYNRVTPLLDLSVVYGNNEERSMAVRLNEGGLLRFIMEGNRETPPPNSPFCLNNRPPETSCYNFGDSLDGNLLLGGSLTTLWFFREHNRIARRLAMLNSCWSDQKLYETARQINIAQWQYIFYYELLPSFIGHKNALKEGIIFDTPGYVDDFDSRLEPGVYREYVIGARWFHTLQPGLSDLYRNGRFVGSRTVVDDILRSGILAVNNTEADLTEGSIIQLSSKLDDVLHPDMSNRVLGELQAASDIAAIDMMRGRDAGLPPYNEYRKLCGLPVAKKFEDFQDTINKDKVEMLRRLYGDVDDVEFMVAVYAEKLLPNAQVGPTLYCVLVHNLLLWRRADKFFFEHGNFPTALTLAQLQEVKKTSIARIICDNGDRVEQIQPHAFLKKGPWNDFVPCKEVPGTDLNKWTDAECRADVKGDGDKVYVKGDNVYERNVGTLRRKQNHYVWLEDLNHHYDHSFTRK